jgi:hypothetical protein
MGSHDPFGHLKHKLWPKEGLVVELPIWLSIIKSQESTRFPCVQIVCDIPLESSWRKLQLCLRLHFNQKFARKVMRPQNRKNPNFGNFPRQNAIWMWASWRGTKYIVKGKVVASPKSRSWWVLWVRICPWLVLAPKVLQLCTNQLVVWFCADPCEWLHACHSS